MEFLPGAGNRGVGGAVHPGCGDGQDRPQLVHLDGLNLSRAWSMGGVASALPPGDPARKGLIDAAGRHAEAALGLGASGDYAGKHRLASLTTYLLSTPMTD